MPQLLSLVGKALGNILRFPGSRNSDGCSDRDCGSFDIDIGFTKQQCPGGASPSASPASSEPSSTQHSSKQNESVQGFVAPTSARSTSPFVHPAEKVNPQPLLTIANSSGRAPTAPRSCSVADAVAPALLPAAPGACSDSSLPGSCSSPPASMHFMRASLSDTTASVAGEALRQASVTTCKHFSRENYNNYVRWVRASRGAMKLAGKMRSRVEASSRNPNPTLLLRCEHWLEVTDEQHRYGSNLRVYFDYWVAEMEAAELTPPASPAFMSPSPSCPHLLALAQQHHQQLQIATAISNAAISEQSMTHQVTHNHRFHSLPYHNQQQRQRAASAAQILLSPVPVDSKPLQQQRDSELVPQAHRQEVCAAVGAAAATGASFGTGPRPSRFSVDVSGVQRTTESGEAPRQQKDEQLDGEEQQRPLKRSESDSRINQLTNHRYLQRNHHRHLKHPDQDSIAAAPGDGGAQDGEGEGQAFGDLDSTLSSKSSQHWEEPPLLLSPEGEGHSAIPLPQTATPPQPSHHQHHSSNHNHQQYDRPQHLQDLELYEREGSVQGCIDEGAGAGDMKSLPMNMRVKCSADGCNGRRCGGDAGNGQGEPLSPLDSADASGHGFVRVLAGSCEPMPTLLHRRKDVSEQQRRRSCGEEEVLGCRRPTAAVHRPSAGAVSILEATTASPVPVTASTPSPHASSISSPHRNVLCSPSRRFVLAVMIDMAAAAAKEDGGGSLGKQQAQDDPQQVQVSGMEGSAGGGWEGFISQEMDRSGSQAVVAAPPATPTQQQSHLQQLQSECTAAPTSVPLLGSTLAATGGGTCAIQRTTKLLSSRASVGSGSSFFRWLDNGPGLEVDLTALGVSRAKLDAERVKYLTLDELLEYELDVDIETGLLRYKRSGKLLHTGPDGRGSLDDHRRPPTPPKPAVPISLLGEGAAAWWRSSSAADAVVATELPSGGCMAALPPLPPFNLAAVSRQAYRRSMAMGTVPEGGVAEEGGDVSLGTGVDGLAGGVLWQSPYGGDISTEAAMASVVNMNDAASSARSTPDEGSELVSSIDSRSGHQAGQPTATNCSRLLPDVGQRGYSTTPPLLGLDPTISACFTVKGYSCDVAPGGGGSSSFTEVPAEISTTTMRAAHAANLSTSAGGAGDGDGGDSMPRTPVATRPSGGGSDGGGYGVGYSHPEERVAKWIYVVDPELRLFVHPKVRGRFHHSSFLRGGAVVAAGGLAARHGRLRLLTADSGHYWPREENFRWLCEHLVYVGSDLSACELRSKHMQVPAATGKELMEKLGVPPPWRLPYQPMLSQSGHLTLDSELPQAAGSEADTPPSLLVEQLLQLQVLHPSTGEAEAGMRGV